MSEEKDNRDMEELTISQAAREFRINRGTLNNWVYLKKLPARREVDQLGTEYYLIQRGKLEQFLSNRRKFGRPLHRTPNR